MYDQDNKPTGIIKPRDEVHKKGFWHRTAHVCVYDSSKEILLQLTRAKYRR